MRVGTLFTIGAVAALAACTDLSVSQGSTAANPDTVATAITKLGGDSQTAVVHTVLPHALVVRVMNAKGQPSAGGAVCFTTVHDGSAIVGASANSQLCTPADSNGYASAAWQLGTRLGAYTAVVLAGAVSISFTAAGTAAAPYSLVAGPSGLSGSANTPLPDSIYVTVQDTFGNVVQGASVAWAATGGSSVSPATSITAANGIARTAWTLGPAGSDTATATVGSLPRALFTATSH